MFHRFQTLAAIAPAVLVVPSLYASPAKAEQPNRIPVSELQQQQASAFDVSEDELSQVTSVSQLRDVQPTDWAFQALQSLVERYGCIAGYPDRTFRGNRALTRYEFAAGLNACMEVMTQLIEQSTADLVRQEDLATLQRLQEEFQAELATLRGRVDSLEARTAELEANQFSTTTKLSGEAVFALSDSFNDDRDTQTVFQNRARLNFVASFTGRDQLNVRLDTGNAEFVGGTNQGAFTYNFDSNNSVELGWMAYYFPIGDKIQVYLPAAFPLWQDFVPTISPELEGFTGANNALTSFGESSPIYKIGLGAGGGIGANYKLSDSLTISAGYFGGDSSDSGLGTGLFNGEYSALGQLTFQPSDDIQLALTYVNAYFSERGSDTGIFDLGVGTRNGIQPFGPNTATITNSFGVEGSWRFSPQFVVNAFGGYTDASETEGTDDAEIWYYGLGLALPDLGGEGNLGGLIAGAEPYVGGLNGSAAEPNADDVAWHVEGFYRYQLNDNISITPGVVWLTAPNGEDDADDAILGTIRTTFMF